MSMPSLLPRKSRIAPRPLWPARNQSTHIDTATVGLEVYGEVANKLRLGWLELASRTLSEVLGSLAISRFGSNPSRVWSGAALEPLIELSEPDPRATRLVAHGEGGYSIHLDLEDVLSGPAILAYSVDGRPLSRSEGGPLRLVMPHLDAWRNAKWLRGLELRIPETRGDAPDHPAGEDREPVPGQSG
jgi:DMSO/TMAO reductase YedYZ molybdopterin-dependent catalytic subunit